MPSNDYFSTIALVWSAYFAKRISMAQRDYMLEIFRAEEFNHYR